MAKLFPDQALPATLTANQKLAFTTDRLVQAYTVLEIEAEAGSELSLDYAKINSIARAGRQTYISSDTRGFLEVRSRSSRVA
jgi:hypothetical protein